MACRAVLRTQVAGNENRWLLLLQGMRHMSDCEGGFALFARACRSTLHRVLLLALAAEQDILSVSVQALLCFAPCVNLLETLPDAQAPSFLPFHAHVTGKGFLEADLVDILFFWTGQLLMPQDASRSAKGSWMKKGG